jgi:hypothetical protein
MLTSVVGLVAMALLATLALAGPAAAAGRSGTTLAAVKTLDICDNGAGIWTYSGEISLWNEGAIDTVGLAITDCIQNKTGSGQFQDVPGYCTTTFDPTLHQITAGTTELDASIFKYSIDAPALAGDIRNIARVTILNHSGSIGTPTGPEPKYTWAGGTPPPCPEDAGGCVHTHGYWCNKPGVVWPSGYNRTDTFFSSGITWNQAVCGKDGPVEYCPANNGYCKLAKQYIAAVLSIADAQGGTVLVPSGVQNTLNTATTFFNSSTTPSTACPSPSSCSAQTVLAGILDSYVNGDYLDGPAHCGDEVLP